MTSHSLCNIRQLNLIDESSTETYIFEQLRRCVLHQQDFFRQLTHLNGHVIDGQGSTWSSSPMHENGKGWNGVLFLFSDGSSTRSQIASLLTIQAGQFPEEVLLVQYATSQLLKNVSSSTRFIYLYLLRLDDWEYSLIWDN